jgi:hypothetical protein
MLYVISLPHLGDELDLPCPFEGEGVPISPYSAELGEPRSCSWYPAKSAIEMYVTYVLECKLEYVMQTASCT